MNSAKGDTFYWMDITSLNQIVPLVNGRVIAKVLRLNRPSKIGLILHRKPILKWIDNLPSKSPSVVQPISSNRTASSDRPQKYTDSERPQKYTDSSTPRPAASVTSPKQQNPDPAKQTSQNTESFEDFLSGGGPSKPKQQVDFMSGGDSWQNPKPNDFIQSMEQPKAPAREKTPPKPVASAPAKNFNDDCGQTVGSCTFLG